MAAKNILLTHSFEQFPPSPHPHFHLSSFLFSICLSREEDFYEIIIEFGGASWFDPDRSNSFAFARILICCQRYGDAIAHLLDAQMDIPAMHLMVLFLYYGLILPFRPLEISSPYEYRKSSGNFDNSPSLPASIIRGHTRPPFQLDYPEETVDYLLVLRTQFADGLHQEMHEDYLEIEVHRASVVIQEVLIELLMSEGRSQLSILVGEVALSAGVPVRKPISGGKSYLDMKLPSPEVVNGLLEFAAVSLSDRHDFDASMLLYQLAGKSDEVTRLLIKQLQACLVPFSPRREAIRTNAIKYYEAYCSSFSSHDKTTIETLLKLGRFMDFCDQHKCQEALDEVYALALLPISSQDVPDRVEYCKHLDDAVKESIDDVLLYTLECARLVYQQIIQETNPASAAKGIAANRAERRANLKARARALVEFANKLVEFIKPQTLGQLQFQLNAHFN